MRPLIHLPRIWTQAKGRSFDIYWSDKWGHGKLHPLPTDVELERFYDTGDYDQYMQGTTDGGTIFRRSLLDRLIDPILYRLVARLGEGEKLDADFVKARIPSPAKVLDIGCGAGLMLADLAKAGYVVAGVDPSSVALDAARSRGIQMFEATGETMTDEVPRAHFDVVTMSQSLEHTRDPLLALKSAAERLRPGGTMIVEVPNCGSAGFKDRQGVWFHTDAGRHIHFFTRKSLEAYFVAAGLKPVEHGFFGVTAQFARIDAEQRCWDELYRDRQDAPKRPDWRSRLSLFFKVLSGSDETRRDMVCVVARKG